MGRGRLADSYPGAVALVVLALVPFLLLTAAVFPLAQVICKSTGLSPGTLDLTVAMSDGAYAFGTVMAVQFAVHLRQRRMLLVYVSVFVVASCLSAWAPTGGVFIGAFVAQGLCTSLMLIAAVPALVTGWPTAKMPVTGAVMNLCIFGAVAVGPTVGALLAAAGSWRPLFWAVAGLGLLALTFSVLTFEDAAAADREARWDLVAVGLAGGGCAAAFFGAGKLEAAKAVTAVALVPLVVGVLMIVALIVYQYRLDRPLMPVKQLATTFPVTGVLIAAFSCAAAFGLMDLLLAALQSSGNPSRTAVLFLPEFGAAVATAVLFGILFRTRFTPVLAFGGMVALAAAAALGVGAVTEGDSALVAVAAGLIGLGVGASVSPALFITGFSLRSSQIQRVFALVELVRGVTAFLVAPVLLFVTSTASGSKAGGLQIGVWACLGLAVGGGLLALAIFVLGRPRLQVPDLARWEEQDEPAWESPPLLARLSRGTRDERAHVDREHRASA
jgi:MFS family permease